MIHIPVLLEPVVSKVKEIEVRDGFFLDGTFGRGGHTRAILEARPDFKVIGIDCDQQAIDFGFKNFENEIASGRLQLYCGNFSDFDRIILSGASLAETNAFGHSRELPLLAGILLDLGVSSPQLDEGPRGFSFYQDGPLDMRMDHTQKFTAADIVNTWDEQSLNDLFHHYGEVKKPFRVTKKILEARKEKPFSRTAELSSLIEKTEGWHKKGHHPATNYFLALRIEVNQELARVESSLPRMVEALLPRGRLLVITFHSLEDRLVKVLLKKMVEEGLGRLVNKKVIQATWPEKKSNPRARSAKLRVFEKLGVT